MPQLEIHHADGNVTYAELSPDKPLMIGSGQNCDVVLSDPGVKRIHCRIVWRDDRWRVEVAADAGGVKLGEKTVKAGTVQVGDIIGIGQCRIYLDEPKQAAKPKSLSDEIASQMVHDTSSALDEAAVEERVLERSTIRKVSHMRDTRSFWRKTWDMVRRTAKEQVRGELDRPPGEERILGSPLVRWLLIGFAVVGALAVYFYLDFREKTIQGHFDKAQKTMGEENWEGAIRLFESFESMFPTHSLASNARVQHALCEIQSSGSPIAAMENVRKMLRERSQEKAFPPIVPKLGEVVARIAQSLAESARDRSDAKSLEQSLEAQELLSKDLASAGIDPDIRAKLEQTMEEARASIKKYENFLGTREKMDKAIADGRFGDAYQAREWLVQLHGDYAEHADIVSRLHEANKLDREAVGWEALGKDAQREPRATAVVASVQLMDRQAKAAGPAADANVQFVLSGGVLFAFDGSTGKTLWTLVVGRDATVLPLALPVAAEPLVLVTDTRHDELVAVQSKTGKLVWRQALNEPIETAPLLHRGRVYQPTSKGSLFVIDPNSGRIDGRLRFPEGRFATTPAPDLSGQHLYLLGEQYVLYVITLGVPPKCDSVFYTAHRPDSIVAAPVRLFRYLVLFENGIESNTNTVLIRVFLLSPDGTAVEELQHLPPKGAPPLGGWVHQVPAVSGNLMFVATDLENVEVYSGGAPEKADGFTKVTSAGGGTTAPGTRGQAYAMMYSEKDLLVAGYRVRHYDYKPEQQTLTPSAEKLLGSASQPIQRYPATGSRAESLYVARRVPTSSAIAFTALDASSLDVRWEVLLGTGVVSLQPADAAKTSWVALTRSGHIFSIPAATLVSGGVLDQPAGRLGGEVELSDKAEPLTFPDGSTVYTPSGTATRLFIRGAAPGAPTRSLDLLAPLQGSLVLFQDGILAPGADGRIYWISPATGKPLAEPFQPPLVADQRPQWRGVALTAKKTIVAVDDGGNIYQIEPRKEPTAHLGERAGSKLPKPIRSGIAMAGNILGCVDEANVLHVWDAEGLSPIAEIKLSGPPSLGPVAAGGHLFVAVGDDELLCVNPQGQEAWRRPLKGEHVTGRPLIKGDVVHLVTTGGLVRALRLADGSDVWTLDTEKPLSGGPVDAGDKLVVIGDDGSLNVIKPPAAGK